MTAALLAEAIDTLRTLGSAFLAWIAVLAAVGTIMILGAATTGAWAWKAAWRAITGTWRRDATDREPADSSPADPSPEPTGDHIQPHTPAWTHTDKDAA